MSHDKRTCPRCSNHGRSVAAMNYEETQRWTKNGTFSGAGVGVGTGGIGVGVGGGSYSERGEMQSKRADVFEEPGQHSLPVFSLILGAGVIVAALSIFPSVFSATAEMTGASHSIGTGGAAPGINIDAMQNAMMNIIKFIIPIGGVLILGIAVSRALKNQEKEDHLNEVERPKLLRRYNQLMYCSHCHTLYDNDGHAEDANEFGFNKLLYETKADN